MKMIARSKSEQNLATIDPWTVVHFASGLALGLMNVPLRLSLGGALVYEVAEQVIEREEIGQEIFQTTRPETLANAFVDVGVFAVGHRAGKLWSESG